MINKELLREILGRAWAIKMCADDALCSIAAGESHAAKDFQDIIALSYYIARIFDKHELLDEEECREIKHQAIAREFDCDTLPRRSATNRNK